MFYGGKKMLCTKCGKNPAVIFIKNQAAPDQHAQALCFKCARELIEAHNNTEFKVLI